MESSLVFLVSPSGCSPSSSWCRLSSLHRNTNKTVLLLGDTRVVSVDSVELCKFTANRRALTVWKCQSQDTDWQHSHIPPQLCVTGSLKPFNARTFMFKAMSFYELLGLRIHLCSFEQCVNTT